MDYEKIKDLIEDMGSSKLSSLEIDFPDGMKIRMKKGNDDAQNGASENLKVIEDSSQPSSKQTTLLGGTSQIQIVENISNEGSSSNNKVETDEQYKYIKSPMVGTFYSKPSPNEDSFVEVGERISKGRTTCIIEAMKLMNEIESEFDGEVVEILKKDGEPVEYGEILIKLK